MMSVKSLTILFLSFLSIFLFFFPLSYQINILPVQVGNRVATDTDDQISSKQTIFNAVSWKASIVDFILLQQIVWYVEFFQWFNLTRFLKLHTIYTVFLTYDQE